MSQCTKIHFVKRGDNKPPIQVPCYYIAGICIVNPIHEGTPELFLRATFPYHHGPTYEESKLAHTTLVPNNIVAADFNLI